MRRFNTGPDIGPGLGFTIIGIFLTGIAAWCTHVIWIIRALASPEGATAGQMALGAIGAFMPPIGVIHGLMLWFGW